ncbi:uncharacterized protein LOC108220748 [Daucus carota subsp. sativus]|uniref:uncharacterized protein LOC108220748 n=1 Tax=Daucus carota subsp. sativus TaxID=79200 RepID=UPI0007EFCA49|nr:PREDICTED: uncharacterized protein LOC108220748 [Daucus carota subsp. sativus]
MSTSLSSPFLLNKTHSQPSGSHIKSAAQCIGGGRITKVSYRTSQPPAKRAIFVQAGYSDGGRPSSGNSIFIGGFVLGGILIGALGAVYAPQISKALAKADKKLPALIYGEEKALEMTRKKLEATIDGLNADIDDISAHLRAEVSPNGVSNHSDEIEA